MIAISSSEVKSIAALPIARTISPRGKQALLSFLLVSHYSRHSPTQTLTHPHFIVYRRTRRRPTPHQILKILKILMTNRIAQNRKVRTGFRSKYINHCFLLQDQKMKVTVIEYQGINSLSDLRTFL